MSMRNLLLLSILTFLVSCKQQSKKSLNPNQYKASEKEITPANEESSDMVYFKGGKIKIGSNTGIQNEQPVFEMEIAPFFLDKNLVSVADFRLFVEKTNYKTEADKFGDSGVYSFDLGRWELLKGANWEYPLGTSKPKALPNHPVTHVSWNDAKVYADWLGKRLPTEFEWEFAAKNGRNNGSKYAWGDSLVIGGKYYANVWQGASVTDRNVLDGYLLTSPVGFYGETELGLTDMGGNVWQWCDNVYGLYPVDLNTNTGDPKIRTTKGGSFMFDSARESSFTTTFRGKNSIDTSLFNTGFRCAK